MKRHAPFLAVLLLLVACATPAILTPKVLPGQCKTREVDCGKHADGFRYCCGEDDICGTGEPFVPCPKDACCPNGGSSSEYSAHPPRPQRRAE